MITAWLIGEVACGETLISPRVLTEEPAVMGISISVLEDGPHALGLAPLPPDRPRAEVLPLDAVELDALVVDVDGPLDLEEAAWVLCGDGCLPSMERQGELHGVLEPCTEDSASRSLACLAGRGVRPRIVLPSFSGPSAGAGAGVFTRAAVIVGSPDGLTSDACVQQLVTGPRVDLGGCAIGVTELRYGPEWIVQELLVEVGLALPGAPTVPPFVAEQLPPNTAPRVDAVRIGAPDDFVLGVPDEHLEARLTHEVLEVEAGAQVTIEPVVQLRDQQIIVSPVGPSSWLGRYERFTFDTWADAPVWDASFGYLLVFEQLSLRAPEVEGPVRLYVVVSDDRDAVSWFTLDLQVVPR